MLDISNIEDKDLGYKLMFSMPDWFEGMSHEDLLRCVSVNPTIILSLENEQLKPDIIARALIGQHNVLDFILDKKHDKTGERHKLFNEEVVKLIYKEVGMTFFYSAYKDLRLLEDKTFMYRAIEHVKTEERRQAYKDFCQKHNIEESQGTYEMFNIMYNEKQEIIDEVMEMADYYTHNLCKHLKDDYEISSGVAMLYQGQTFGNILSNKSKHIIKKYADSKYADNIKDV